MATSRNRTELFQHRHGVPDAALEDDLAVLPAHHGDAAGLGDLAGGRHAEEITGMLRLPGPLERAEPLVADVVEDLEAVIALAGIGDLEAFEELADRKSTRLNSSHSQISYAV